MKPLDEVKLLQGQIDEESRHAMLDMLITSQIQGLEKLIETNGAYVKSPIAYNMCVGLIQQIKYWSLASFENPEKNLDKEMNAYEEEYKPQYGAK